MNKDEDGDGDGDGDGETIKVMQLTGCPLDRSSLTVSGSGKRGNRIFLEGTCSKGHKVVLEHQL